MAIRMVQENGEDEGGGGGAGGGGDEQDLAFGFYIAYLLAALTQVA